MKNISFSLKKAEPGFAELMDEGERFMTIRSCAKKMGLHSIPFPGKKNCYIISDGLRSFVFYNSEVYVKPFLHERHNNKHETKKKLKAIGVSVPRGIQVPPNSKNVLLEYYRSNDIGECVLKPAGLNKGTGVFVGLKNEDELVESYSKIKEYHCLIEEYIPGDEHRFLVVGGRVVAVAKRVPANIVGDGVLSIRELVEQKNNLRKKSPVHKKYLIKIDNFVVDYLEGQGVSLDAVPERGKVIYLRKISNVSIGGDSEDVTEKAHQDFIRVAEKIWEAFSDRAIYGVDLICQDVALPASEQKYAVIEVNNRPGIRGSHGYPIYGNGRQVGKKILEYIFG